MYNVSTLNHPREFYYLTFFISTTGGLLSCHPRSVCSEPHCGQTEAPCSQLCIQVVPELSGPVVCTVLGGYVICIATLNKPPSSLYYANF